MKATDLMLGNIVEYNGMDLTISEIYTPKPRKPKKFDGIECVELLCDGFINATMDEIKPIPLTEDILVKCRETLHGIEYIVKALALPIKLRKNCNIWYCEFGNVYLGDRLKHLHQLQNLYHSLTGQELNVEL